jgi:SHS family lactate transporter-like MFS transporter
MIIPAICGFAVIPFYLLSHDYFTTVVAFTVQRFPTEVRATAAGFCYHQGAIWGGLAAPVLAYFAASQASGFVIPMMVAQVAFAATFIIALFLGPETKGDELLADLHEPAIG